MSEALEATNPVAEPAETPAPAGVADEANAPGDDQSQFDPDAWVNEGSETPAEAGQGDEETGETQPEDGLEEIELSDGTKVRVPKEIALDRLRHADYTKKTQEVAEQRRQLESAQEAWRRQQAESVAALPEEHAKIAIIARDIEGVKAALAAPDQNGVALGAIDWNAFRQQALANPQMADLYRDYRAKYDAAHDTLRDLERARGEAQNDLKTKEDQRLQAQREHATQALAKRQEETGKVLAEKIEGWNADKAAEIAQFAVKEAGVSPDELPEMTDPRIWMLLNRVMQAETANKKMRTALKQHETAANNTKAQVSQPAAKVGGASPNVRKTTDASGDQLSTEEWARRERERMAAKAKR